MYVAQLLPWDMLMLQISLTVKQHFKHRRCKTQLEPTYIVFKAVDKYLRITEVLSQKHIIHILFQTVSLPSGCCCHYSHTGLELPPYSLHLGNQKEVKRGNPEKHHFFWRTQLGGRHKQEIRLYAC